MPESSGAILTGTRRRPRAALDLLMLMLLLLLLLLKREQKINMINLAEVSHPQRRRAPLASSLRGAD